jgi:hypothetical protein
MLLRAMTDVRDGISQALPGQPSGGGDSVDVRLTRLETVLATILPTLATKADVAEVKADVAEVKTDLVRILLTGLAIAVAVLIFAINRASPPQAAPSNAQPIVIFSPPPGNAPTTAPAPQATQPGK